MTVGSGPSRSASYPGGGVRSAFKSTPSARLSKGSASGPPARGAGAQSLSRRGASFFSSAPPSSSEVLRVLARGFRATGESERLHGDRRAVRVADPGPGPFERVHTVTLPQTPRLPRVEVEQIQKRLVPGVARRRPPAGARAPSTSRAGSGLQTRRRRTFAPADRCDALFSLGFHPGPSAAGPRSARAGTAVGHAPRQRRCRARRSCPRSRGRRGAASAVRAPVRVHDPGTDRARLVPGLVQDPEPVRAPRDAAVAQSVSNRATPAAAGPPASCMSATYVTSRATPRRAGARRRARSSTAPRSLSGRQLTPATPRGTRCAARGSRPRAAGPPPRARSRRRGSPPRRASGSARPSGLVVENGRAAPRGWRTRRRPATGSHRVHPRLAVPERRHDVVSTSTTTNSLKAKCSNRSASCASLSRSAYVRACATNAGVGLHARPARRRGLGRARRSVRGHNARRDGGGVEPGVGLEERI